MMRYQEPQYSFDIPNTKYYLSFEDPQYVISGAHEFYRPYLVRADIVIAIVDKDHDNVPVGVCAFFGDLFRNVDLLVIGPLNIAIVRKLAFIAVKHFHASRVSVRTFAENHVIIGKLVKLGFVFECVETDYFGRGYSSARLVMFPDQISRWARHYTRLVEN